MSDSQARSCASCAKSDIPLLLCSGCKLVSYRNKDCQKAHWKAHKPYCALKTKGAQASSKPEAEEDWVDEDEDEPKVIPGSKAGDQDKKPYTAIANNVWLHDRTRTMTFKLLIDSQRIRQRDMLVLDGELMAGTIYNGEPSSEPAFRTFIRKAQAVKGLLPPWWTESSVDDCLKYSRSSARFSLADAQQKYDIQEAWDDLRMPMKLRMMAEEVYGYTPGGIKRDGMLADMLAVERGDHQLILSSPNTFFINIPV